MKAKLGVIFIVLVSLLNAQDRTGGELNFNILNYSIGKTITITMAPAELIPDVPLLRWNVDKNNPSIHDLILDPNLYDGGTIVYNPYGSGTVEFLGCWESDSLVEYRTFALGLYKVFVQVNGIIKDQFIIDYRTSSISEYWTIGSGDINLDFNVQTGKIYYHESTTEFPSNTTIWTEKPLIPNDKTLLEPLPPTNFQVSNQNGHPYLSWNHSNDGSDWWTGYSIYRSVVSGTNGPASFYKIESVGANQTSFTDFDFSVGGPMTAYYKVAALNDTRESIFTPIHSCQVGFYKENNSSSTLKYSLNQNYPNPFNPLTNISYTLPVEQQVSIKIYDVLGNEISTLVNEIKEEGEHNINFNAATLKSGVYFYIMRTNGYVDIKKLVVIK